jgi:Na+-driven multidrug efflux pump
VLIPQLGVIGAATATTITRVIWNVVLWIAGWQKTGLDASVFCLFRKTAK